VLDLSFRFDRWIDALPKSPADSGRVERLVLRTGRGERATPQRVELRVGGGIVGDTWAGHEHALPENEVALMNVHVLRAVCAGDEARMALAGDNLLVDLDLSEVNLPVGSRLHVGEAVLRVASLPHRPCDKFVQRFGARAAKRIARANRRGLRGRGVLCTIERGGGVAVGDTIRVERP